MEIDPSRDGDRTAPTKPTLVVLTDPLLYGRWRYVEILRRVARFCRDKVMRRRIPRNETNYRGHFAVTRSLVEGLTKASLPFSYNTFRLNNKPAAVIVLSGRRTLKQAIQLKRRGLISNLFAGPNIVVLPSDAPNTLAAQEVDRVVVPSRWVRDVYESDDPELVGKCEIWAAGIDVDFWSPGLEAMRDKILVYVKNSDIRIPDYVERRVEPFSHHYVHYGQYDQSTYRRLLSEAKLLIGFSHSESQGIAWLEAWSMDVPTLIFDVERGFYRDKTFGVSSAPYLSKFTGAFFNNEQSFDNGWNHWMLSTRKLSPREWVLENLSDTRSASELYALITRVDAHLSGECFR